MSGPWSLFELFLGSSDIRVLDIGAAIVETPPYQSWIDLGKQLYHHVQPIGNTYRMSQDATRKPGLTLVK